MRGKRAVGVVSERAPPRRDGERAALQALMTARDSAMDAAKLAGAVWRCRRAKAKPSNQASTRCRREPASEQRFLYYFRGVLVFWCWLCFDVGVVSSRDYGQFLVNSPQNFTGTYFADTTASFSHDSVYRFLKDSKFSPKVLREKAMEIIEWTPTGKILFDDTVLSKTHSKKIRGAYKQWSGNAHSVITGIGVVTCVYFNPVNGRTYPLDYRIFDPECDGKTKLDHVTEMMTNLVHNNRVLFTHFLMDTWYATTKILNEIMNWKKLFVCPVKSNRLTSTKSINGAGFMTVKVKDLDWENHEVFEAKLKGLPASRLVRIFRIITTIKTEHIITNDVALQTTDDAKTASAIRWKIEEFHRSLKQLSGIEKCQARLRRSQRNHICIAMLAWLQLQTRAWETGESIYHTKQDPLKQWVKQQWKQPATIYNLT